MKKISVAILVFILLISTASAQLRTTANEPEPTLLEEPKPALIAKPIDAVNSADSIDSTSDSDADLLLQRKQETQTDFEKLMEMDRRIKAETDPAKKRQLRMEGIKIFFDLMQKREDEIRSVRENMERIRQLHRRNIFLGVARGEVDKKMEQVKEIEALAYKVRSSPSFEDKLKYSQELRQKVREFNKNIPYIRQLSKAVKRIQTKKEMINRLAQKVQDPAVRKKIEEMQKKRAIAVEKRREVFRLLNAETGKEEFKTLYQIVLEKSQARRENVDVIEEIPKSIAENVAQVEFSIEPSEILLDDPIVKWNFEDVSAGENLSLSYWVSGEHEEEGDTLVSGEETEEIEQNDSDVRTDKQTKKKNPFGGLFFIAIIIGIGTYFVVKKRKEKQNK